MQGPIYTELTPVRQRQQQLFALRLAFVGLLVGSLVGIGLGLGRWLGGWSVSPWLAFALLLAGPVVGGVVGLTWRRSWEAAAAAVDAHFGFKDRIGTALQFLTKPEPSGYHEMQVRDALVTLRRVELRQAVPFWLPRSWPLAVGLFLVAFGLLAWPLGSQPAAASPETLPTILEEADFIDESLNRLEDLALLDQNKELAKLVDELRQKVEEMRQPGVDLKQALAKISEMQAAIQAETAQYSVPLVDAHLKELGEALTAAGSLQEAGKALQEGRFDKAAKELDKQDAPPEDRKEAKSVEDKLQKAAKSMKGSKLERLAAATSKMASGVRGEKSEYKKGANEVAQEVRNHERRRRINQLLAFEQERLGECKSRCQNNTLTWLQQRRQNQNQNESQNQSQSQAQQQQKAKGAGSEPGSKELGGKTGLQAQRKRDRVEGQEGIGSSEVETENVPEARQQSERAYRDRYSKALQLSETALDSEPIPLRQRRVIRKYFELIRPQNSDGN